MPFEMFALRQPEKNLHRRESSNMHSRTFQRLSGYTPRRVSKDENRHQHEYNRATHSSAPQSSGGALVLL